MPIFSSLIFSSASLLHPRPFRVGGAEGGFHGGAQCAAVERTALPEQLREQGRGVNKSRHLVGRAWGRNSGSVAAAGAAGAATAALLFRKSRRLHHGRAARKSVIRVSSGRSVWAKRALWSLLFVAAP